MHSTDLPSGGYANHHGDYSGDVTFNIRTGLAIPFEEVVKGCQYIRVSIPFGDLRALVLGHLRGVLISKIEQSSDDIEQITRLERMNDDDLEKYFIDCGA